ncbi:gluconate:H+ symporter [Asticcacaulis benevestitus]|uniref:Gnt-II system L-idonate transporter IdnT n=1 Tax=Asticcacaulis benevestitus DSM 16100 = ATCC BAA-896 TaxID=1121022 RepID=V4PNF8_9CAUL|nr:gluconate:H+ symporter [Asticcacaulis benevestitus]ESQ89791.1 Gnt-II system L-idonate transporter IdnT [Asticcacaulis benevestitus DSM 16100 = ATCC BAA-896]
MITSIATDTSGTVWQLTAVVIAVLSLVAMIGWGKMQPLLAFVIASIGAAVLLQMPLDTIPKSIEKGIGDMLGSLAVLLALGAIFGKMIADSGAAQKIASVLIKAFGASRMSLALALTGFVVGIPLFYNVGFVLLAPLVFSLGRQSGKSLVWLAIPLMAGLSVAHGFLPPHPSPSAIVPMLGGDMGLTLLYGLAVGIPTVLIAGPAFAMTVGKIAAQPPELFVSPPVSDQDLPSAFNAFGTALLPVVLLSGATALSYSGLVAEAYKPLVAFISHPILVMLIAVMVASLSLGMCRGTGFRHLMEKSGSALREIAPILLIIAGAGALKQILIDSGVSAVLGSVMQTLPLPPLVLGWLIAGAIRVSLGSATVAGLTAAGLVAPLVASSGVNPNLMVLAVGAGSLMFSHVNDSGFWMFKEYFGLSVRDTLRTWTLMEGLVGIVGLICVLVLNQFVG